MMTSDNPRLEKSRTVKSRYLSPVSAAEPPLSLPASPSHHHPISPNRHQKHKSSLEKTGLLRGVWPSSTPHSLKSHNDNPPAVVSAADATTTLAEYLGNDRKKDSFGSKFLNKQRSCSEFSRFENDPKKQNNLKENHKPIFGGGSMRYTGKFRFPGRSSTSSSPTSSDDGARRKLTDIMPGRLSVDENKIRRRSYSLTRSDHSFSDDSECSDIGSPYNSSSSLASYMAPTVSSKRSAIKKAMKKVNSLSKWGSSSSRPESPPTPTTTSFPSSSKPPTSPSKNGKKNLLNMGLDLIKSKKTGPDCVSPTGSGVGMVESVHQLRMMHGSWMRWRYANARASVVNKTLDEKAKKDILHVRENMANLQQSVLQKRLQLEKEKLEMKLNTILHSQMKMLEAWKDMERMHTSDVLMTKDCLESVACKVPLIAGAKMDPQTSAIVLRHATDVVASVMSTMSSLMPMAHESVSIFSELAKVTIEEKLLLEECLEHFKVISTLEIEERSLRCNIIKLASCDNKQ